MTTPAKEKHQCEEILKYSYPVCRSSIGSRSIERQCTYSAITLREGKQLCGVHARTFDKRAGSTEITKIVAEIESLEREVGRAVLEMPHAALVHGGKRFENERARYAASRARLKELEKHND
jgi:hypothetical protein